jgi:uncharacterized membrane protein
MPEKPETPINSPVPPPSSMRQIPILPGTRLGWWAVGLGVVTLLFPLLTWLINLLLNIGTNAVPRGIAVPGTLMAAVAIASGILGLLAVLRSKERAVLVWLPIFFGFFFFFLVIIDIVAAL